MECRMRRHTHTTWATTPLYVWNEDHSVVCSCMEDFRFLLIRAHGESTALSWCAVFVYRLRSLLLRIPLDERGMQRGRFSICFRFLFSLLLLYWIEMKKSNFMWFVHNVDPLHVTSQRNNNLFIIYSMCHAPMPHAQTHSCPHVHCTILEKGLNQQTCSLCGLCNFYIRFHRIWLIVLDRSRRRGNIMVFGTHFTTCWQLCCRTDPLT